MKIITCNFQGRKHFERNEPCEDSVNYILGSNITTVAVADGAGSKKYSHAKDGADAVTKAVCNFFEAKFDNFFDSTNELELRTVIQTICHKALKERAGELGLDSIETLASTLLTVSIKGNKAVCIQIGDGLIGRMVHGEPETITLPQNGEYASSTYFVNDAEAYKMIQVRKMFLNGTSHVFLMSDGIADCMFNDFTGEFNKSMGMLIEASDDTDGEEQVRKAVKEFIVDADPMSDDCTMAVVCLNNSVASVKKEKAEKTEPVQLDVDFKESVSDVQVQNQTYSQVIHQQEMPLYQPMPITEQMVNVQNNVPVKKKKGSIAKIVVAALALILAIIIGAGALILLVTNKDEDRSDDDIKDTITSSMTTDENIFNSQSENSEESNGLNINVTGQDNS